MAHAVQLVAIIPTCERTHRTDSSNDLIGRLETPDRGSEAAAIPTGVGRLQIPLVPPGDVFDFSHTSPCRCQDDDFGASFAASLLTLAHGRVFNIGVISMRGVSRLSSVRRYPWTYRPSPRAIAFISLVL